MTQTDIDWFHAQSTSLLSQYIEKCHEVAEVRKTALLNRATIVDMVSMIDGAYEVVELFGYRGSPAQKEWAKSWLEKARSYGASPE